MSTLRTLILGTLLITLGLAGVAQAGNAGAIQERMRGRLPAINLLKEQGIIGENNQGFLQFLKAPQQSQLIDSENRDRKLVYQAIAKQQGVSPQLVGNRRALSLAKKSKSGFFQDNQGKWFQKQ